MNLWDWQRSVRLKDNEGDIRLKSPIGIFVHLYYEDLIEEILEHINNINFQKVIYVTTTSNDKRDSILKKLRYSSINSPVLVTLVPNVGFDIAPFCIQYGSSIKNHSICLKIHGKKSFHSPPVFGDRWRRYLYEELMGSQSRVNSIVRALMENDDLGMLMPYHYSETRNNIGVGPNYQHMKNILDRFGISFSENHEIDFPSGSMFWFRSEALAALHEVDLFWSDFASGAFAKDGTLAHALERCFLYFCVLANKNWGFLPPFAATV